MLSNSASMFNLLLHLLKSSASQALASTALPEEWCNQSDFQPLLSNPLRDKCSASLRGGWLTKVIGSSWSAVHCWKRHGDPNKKDEADKRYRKNQQQYDRVTVLALAKAKAESAVSVSLPDIYFSANAFQRIYSVSVKAHSKQSSARTMSGHHFVQQSHDNCPLQGAIGGDERFSFRHSLSAQ